MRILTLLLLMAALPAAAQMPTVAAACHSTAVGPDRPGVPRPVVTAETLLVLRKMVREGRFGALDAVYAAYGRSARLDVRNEIAWAAAYEAVAVPDKSIEQPLSTWVKETGSLQSRLARATYRNARAWHARGEDDAEKTSDSAFAATFRWQDLAAVDLQYVLQEDSTNILALLLLNDMAKVRGAVTLARYSAGAAIHASPASWLVRSSLIQSIEPRWGGSYEEMIAFADSAQVYAEQYPQLRALRGYAALDSGYELQRADSNASALAMYNDGLKYGDSSLGRYYRGNLLREMNRFGAAIADLNCAASLAPWRADILAVRGVTRIALGASGYDAFSFSLRQQGMADLRLAEALNPADSDVQWATQNYSIGYFAMRSTE